ncbi:MAG: hypothetical protein H6831_13760 [Planctomycetes bacterium]|nr:hypothetical protein [Planctomycetota bacterium]MCB9905465.1 hypothetical protein [Planctomycetota bacterium]
METKEIEVDCPCCDTRLVIDVRTRTVLKHAPRTQLDETGRAKLDEGRWDQAIQRTSGRVDEATSKLNQALEDERAKESRLDDLFDKANKKLRDKGE